MLNYTDVKNVDIQKNIQLAMNKVSLLWRNKFGRKY